MSLGDPRRPRSWRHTLLDVDGSWPSLTSLSALDSRESVLDGISSASALSTGPVIGRGKWCRLQRRVALISSLTTSRKKSSIAAEIDAQRSARSAVRVLRPRSVTLAGLEPASYGSVTGRLVGQSPSNFDQQGNRPRTLTEFARNGGDQRGRSCCVTSGTPVEHHHAGDRPHMQSQWWRKRKFGRTDINDCDSGR